MFAGPGSELTLDVAIVLVIMGAIGVGLVTKYIATPAKITITMTTAA